MPTIAANLIIQDGELLMLYRDDKGYWELPAGKIEQDETAEEAARREASEEIGVEVDIKTEWESFRTEFEHEGRNFSTRGFISEIKEGDPGPEEEIFGELRWISAAQIEDIDMAPNLEIIKEDLKHLLRD